MKFLIGLPQWPREVPNRTPAMTFMINSSPQPRAFLLCATQTPLSPHSSRAYSNPSLFAKLTNLALVQGPHRVPPADPNEGTGPRSCGTLSACTLTWLPQGPLQMCHVLPPGPVSSKPSYFTFPGSLLLNLFHPIRRTLSNKCSFNKVATEWRLDFCSEMVIHQESEF